MSESARGAATLPPELWDIERLCEFLGTSKNFVYRLTREHRIRHMKAELRFDPRDVADFISREMVEVSDQPPLPRRRGWPRNATVESPTVPPKPVAVRSRGGRALVGPRLLS